MKFMGSPQKKIKTSLHTCAQNREKCREDAERHGFCVVLTSLSALLQPKARPFVLKRQLFVPSGQVHLDMYEHITRYNESLPPLFF